MLCINEHLLLVDTLTHTPHPFLVVLFLMLFGPYSKLAWAMLLHATGRYNDWTYGGSVSYQSEMISLWGELKSQVFTAPQSMSRSGFQSAKLSLIPSTSIQPGYMSFTPFPKSNFIPRCPTPNRKGQIWITAILVALVPCGVPDWPGARSGSLPWCSGGWR